MVKPLLNQWKQILLLRIIGVILKKYISYNYNYIDSVIEVNWDFYINKVKSILSHFNYVYCGVEISNMSKRIVNKVFICADDLNIKIYYQDTDSIHLNYEDVGTIVEIFKDI